MIGNGVGLLGGVIWWVTSSFTESVSRLGQSLGMTILFIGLGMHTGRNLGRRWIKHSDRIESK
jgi:hypothetical protein